MVTLSILSSGFQIMPDSGRFAHCSRLVCTFTICRLSVSLPIWELSSFLRPVLLTLLPCLPSTTPAAGLEGWFATTVQLQGAATSNIPDPGPATAGRGNAAVGRNHSTEAERDVIDSKRRFSNSFHSIPFSRILDLAFASLAPI